MIHLPRQWTLPNINLGMHPWPSSFFIPFIPTSHSMTIHFPIVSSLPVSRHLKVSAVSVSTFCAADCTVCWILAQYVSP